MKRLLTLVLIVVFSSAIFSQEEIHEFEMLHEVKTTPVKSQGKSGTCWVFAATSYVETELLRLGFDELDMSEMFTVRHKLLSMAEKYIRYHGSSSFGDGGQAHDLLDVISDYGIVPEEVYSGKNIGLDKSGINNVGKTKTIIKAKMATVCRMLFAFALSSSVMKISGNNET